MKLFDITRDCTSAFKETVIGVSDYGFKMALFMFFFALLCMSVFMDIISYPYRLWDEYRINKEDKLYKGE
jgi:hypothetical protein